MNQISDDLTLNYLKDESDPDDQVMTKFFVPLRVLGKGAFATVIAAFDKLAQQQVAIKIIDKGKFKKSQIEMFKREATILGKLNHPNIVRMKMSKETQGKFYIVLEQIEGQVLEDFIKSRKENNNPLTEYEIKQITVQLCKAIKYFHEKDIIHRDLKPENIMIHELDQEYEFNDKKLQVKIIDFGLAYQLDTQGFFPVHDNCGTLLYMAPEVALQREYNRSVDIWSLGIIVFTMFTMGKHPFWSHGMENKKSFIDKLKNPQWTFWPENINKAACNFLTKTVTRRAEYRMTSQQCLKHPWLYGEGEINDPITMGDMVATFSNMQNLSRLIKGVAFLGEFKKFMEKIFDDAVIHRPFTSQTSYTTETFRETGADQGSYRKDSSFGDSFANSQHQKTYSLQQDLDESIKIKGIRSNQGSSQSYKRPGITLNKNSNDQKLTTSNSAGLLSRKKYINNKFSIKKGVSIQNLGMLTDPILPKTIQIEQIQKTPIIKDQNQNEVQNNFHHKQRVIQIQKQQSDPNINKYTVEPLFQSTVVTKKQQVQGNQMMAQSTLFLLHSPKQGTKQDIQKKIINCQENNYFQSVKLPKISSKPPLIKQNSHLDQTGTRIGSQSLQNKIKNNLFNIGPQNSLRQNQNDV